MIFRKLIDRGLHPVGGLPATHVCRNRAGEAPLGEAPLTSAETLRERCTTVCSL